MFFFESFYYFYSLKTKLFYNEMKHIRLIFSAILLSLVVPCGYAQTRQDSLAIAHAQWHTDTLQHGAVCMYTNIHVFDSPQQISIIKYDPKKYKTQIVQAPQMTMTSHLAKENQAEAAINGSYFNVNRSPHDIYTARRYRSWRNHPCRSLSHRRGYLHR